MPHRLILVALTLCAALAFAPAPLPKPDRGSSRPEITLESFQGLWCASSMVITRGNGRVEPHPYSWSHARVVNDRWTFMTKGREGGTLFISIDATRKPALMNFYHEAEKKEVHGVGLLRRHNGKVQLMYRWGGEQGRPPTFETAPAGLWIVPLKK